MISSTSPVLGLDLDGVVADLCAGFRRCGERVTGQRLNVVNKNAYALTTRYGVSADLINDVFTVGTDTGDLYADMPPITERIGQVRELHESGWKVHVVTARNTVGNPVISEQATRWWLDHHSIPHDALTLTDKKHTVAGLTVLADDTPRMVDQQHLHHGRNAAVLVDADWNQERIDLPRISDLSELAAATAGSH